MPVTIHQITAVLNMPDDYLGQVKHASDVIIASKASTYVKVPPTNFTTADDALAKFQNAATSAARPLRQSLQSIMSFFQSAANADAAN